MPSVCVHRTTGFSVAAGACGHVPWEAVDWDQGTSVAQYNGNNNMRLPCQQAGVYNITGMIV
jgi:hypothetical protein